MKKDWVKEMEKAQKQKTYRILGKEFARIPYGGEDQDWGSDKQPCHDCAVEKGQLHVPGCDLERCPSCKHQSIGCDCPDEVVK